MKRETFSITQEQLDSLLEYYRSIKPATEIEELYDKYDIWKNYQYIPSEDDNDLSYKSFLNDNDRQKIKNDLKDLSTNKKEDPKIVFNDILNKYLDNHKNSIVDLTYDKISRAVGGMSASKLSNIVNSIIESERKDILLICDTLEADENDINRMLVSCNHPKLQTYRSAKKNLAKEDITMRLMLRWKKENEVETLTSYIGTSLDLYNEISKLPFEE